MRVTLIFRIAFLALFLVAPEAGAYAAIMKSPVSITSRYEDGSEIQLSCNAKNIAMCKITIMLDGKKKAYSVDFSKVNLKPTFKFISFYTADGNNVSIYTSVTCDEIDDKALNNGMTAGTCTAHLYGDDKQARFDSVAILPYWQPVSRSLIQ